MKNIMILLTVFTGQIPANGHGLRHHIAIVHLQTGEVIAGEIWKKKYIQILIWKLRYGYFDNFSFLFFSKLSSICPSFFLCTGPGDLGSIPGRVIPKTLKMELDTTLLNTQHYKVRFKGKVEQSWEWSSALPYTLV